MVFSSLSFLLLFLPVFLAGVVVARYLPRSEILLGWIALSSCIFYAVWDPWNLLILFVAMAVTFSCGNRLAHAKASKEQHIWLLLGIIFNVILLGWFKYRHFLIGDPTPLVLPLGISFIVFQKIAWLVDVFKKRATADRPFEFVFFVTFFPQLIAGPIVHYRELIPQIHDIGWSTFNANLFTRGVFLFALGLSKKLLIADQIAPMVNTIYTKAQTGAALSPWQSCGAGLGFGLQLYFDFSGYADMALGLAAMVGLRLPANFNSPYLATSIIAFWRRWHITLSHWLRDYLFIPLGGSRHGFTRHIFSLLITMLIGGLWHGAAWTFVIWGGLHGALLLIAHAWRRLSLPRIAPPLSWLLTFINVMTLWILFRAPDLTTAYHLYGSLLGNWSIEDLHGQTAYTILFDAVAGKSFGLVLWIPVALTIALVPYNSNDLANLDIAKSATHHWGLTLFQGLVAGALVTVCLRSLLQQPSTEFLYFAF